MDRCVFRLAELSFIGIILVDLSWSFFLGWLVVRKRIATTVAWAMERGVVCRQRNAPQRSD